MQVDSNPIIARQVNEQQQQEPHVSWLKKWGSLIVLSLALAIIVIDTTLLNVSLGAIIRDLHTNLQSIQWVITAYALMLSAFTITGGRLGDLFGRKKMFMLGAVIFAIGSFISSISKNVPTMIMGEAIIEGIGAAMMMPATASLLVSNFKGRDRQIAFGIWGGVAGASAAIGPILGGYLTTYFSWRWGFRINVGVAALLLIGSVLVKEGKDFSKKTGLDILGVLLSSVGLLSIVFGIIESSTYGWWKAIQQLSIFGWTLNLGSLSVTPLFILLGLIILGIFLWWEKKVSDAGKTPLVSLKIFQNEQFLYGVLTMGVVALGQAGAFFSLPVFWQAVRNFDALHTGLALLPLSLSLLVAAPLSAYIAKYVPIRRLIQIGLFIAVVAIGIIGLELNSQATILQVMPGLIAYGFGMGLVMSQISNMTLSAVSVQEAGEASGINNTFRQLGSTLGSAILGAVLISVLASNFSAGIYKSTDIPLQYKNFIAQQVSKQSSNIEFQAPTVSASVPSYILTELKNIARDATTTGDKRAMLYGTIFAFLGFLISFKLPDFKHAEEPQMPTLTEQAGMAEEERERRQSWQDQEDQAVVYEENYVAQPQDYQGQRLSPVYIVVLLLLAMVAGGSVGYAIAQHRNKNNVSIVAQNTQQTTGRSDQNIVSQNPPAVQTPSAPTGSSSAPASPQQDTKTAVKPSPKPAVKTAPAPSISASSTIQYSSPELHMAITIPNTWHITQQSNGDILFFDSTGATRGQLDALSSEGETLQDFVSELQTNSQLYNFTRTSIGGITAIQYYSHLEPGKIVVLVYRGIIYTFRGELVSEPIVGTIRFN